MKTSGAFLILAACLATSCTMSLDLNRFRTGTDPLESVAFYDVEFTATYMESHVREYFEIRIVDRANRIQAKAVYDDVVGPNLSLYLHRVVPKTTPPYRIDFWADHNRSHGYDGIEGGINEKDHAWRRELRDPLPPDVKFVDGYRYEVDFLHDTAFVDIFTDLDGKKISGADTLLPCKLKFIGGGGPHAGKMLEFRVLEAASGRLVGLHRRGMSPAETYEATVPGIVDEVTAYQVLIYADVNADGKYSAGDPSWQLDRVSSGNGLFSDVDLSVLPQAAISTGEK